METVGNECFGSGNVLKGKNSPVRGIFLACGLLAGLAGCGLFSPRDSETPPAPSAADPFNLAGLFEQAVPSVGKPNYDALIADTSVYQQDNALPVDKQRLITRVGTVDSKYPNIHVVWTFSNSDPPMFKTTDTTVLNNVLYKVFVNGTTDSSLVYAGSSYFRIIFIDYLNQWQILYWNDIPSNAYQGYSFFNPSFPSP
jgi:hypothetical protein